jgi:hypothetical protein
MRNMTLREPVSEVLVPGSCNRTSGTTEPLLQNTRNRKLEPRNPDLENAGISELRKPGTTSDK